MIKIDWSTLRIAFAFCYHDSEFAPDVTKGCAFVYEYILN